jgi:hypothetical protein
MAFTLDSTFGTLLDNPQAKAVLENHLPGVSTNPLVGMAKGMTLRVILSMPQASQMGITKEKTEAVLTEINNLVGKLQSNI